MGLKLVGEIALDGAGFERGLHRAGEHVTDFVKNAAVAAFGFYGVEEAIKKTVETASDLVNESKRLDVTVEQLQLLRQAAKDGGTEMGNLAGAFEKLDIARAKALAGDKDALKAFGRLGVSGSQLKNDTAATIFTGSISNAAKNNSVEDISPALKAILGKGFGELIPVLKTDFDELSDHMKSLGTLMDADTAVKLKALGDNFELLKQILAAQLGPVLLTLVESIFTLIGKIKAAAAFWGTIVEHLTNLQPKDAKDDVKTSDGKINFWKAMWAEIFDGGAAKPEVRNVPADAAAQAAEDEWTKTIEDLRKKLEAEAKKIENPVPRTGDTGDLAAKTKHLHNIPADALVKVGNFLGANGNVIDRVNKQKIDLMKQHITVLHQIKDKIGGGGSFGTGIGVPLT